MNTLNQPIDQTTGRSAINLNAAVSASYAAILLQFVKQQGVDAQRAMRHAAIDDEVLNKASGKISAQQYADLISAVLLLSNDEAIGLRYGQRLNITTHGLLGYAVMSSPSLEKSAELAMKYIKIRNQLIDIEFMPGREGDANEVAIGFEVSLANSALYRFEIDTSISSLFSIWQELLGSSQEINALHFSYTQPEDLSVYRQFFGNVPLHFNMPANAMFVKIDAFEKIHANADPSLSEVAVQQCEELLSQHQKKQPAEELEKSVRRLLLQSPGSFLSQQQIAESLSMTTRTLNRQLKKQGTGYQ